MKTQSHQACLSIVRRGVHCAAAHFGSTPVSVPGCTVRLHGTGVERIGLLPDAGRIWFYVTDEEWILIDATDRSVVSAGEARVVPVEGGYHLCISAFMAQLRWQ